VHRQGKRFFRLTRKKAAGIAALFQGFLTQSGGKRIALACDTNKLAGPSNSGAMSRLSDKA